MKINLNSIVKILSRGGIGIIPTDTVYGMVGSALFPGAVERIYRIKRRDAKKPFIILISNKKELASFGIKLDKKTEKTLDFIWPGRVSVILPCLEEEFEYLHRGRKSLAFRVPKDKRLLELIRKTGPLAAPSANFSGEEPVKDISEAKRSFGKLLDFYLDGGKIEREPSSIIAIKDGKIRVVRKGVSDEKIAILAEKLC